MHNIISSFPKGSAAGNSLFRNEFLAECIAVDIPSVAQKFINGYTTFLNILAAGKAPISFSPYIAGGAGTALSKKGGGVRPIVAGEVFRRHVSKGCCLKLRKEIQNHFEPHQVGVGVPGGCEAAVHATNLILNLFGTQDDFVLLKVDFENAFNLIDREAFLSQIAIHFPSLLPWVSYMYANHSHIIFGDMVISSQSGVQQGDPLGPLLFSLPLLLIIEEIKKECDLLLNVWYLDDGTLVGTAPEIAKALEIIQKKGPKLGLHLNLSKCEIFWPSEGALSFSTKIQEPFPILPDIIPRKCAPFTELLGALILDPAIKSDTIFFSEVVSCLNGKVENIRRVHENLPKLEDPQIEYSLLRSCLNFGKINYLLRTVPPKFMEEPSIEFDELSRSTLEQILTRPISNMAWDQASLPTKMSGLGITKANDIFKAAYLSSRMSSMNRTLAILGQSELNTLPDLASLEYILSSMTLPSNINIHDCSSQSYLSGFIQSQNVLNLKQAFNDSEDTRSLARLMATSDKFAGNYLNVIPNDAFGTKMLPNEFRMALLYRLGIPLLDNPTTTHNKPRCINCAKPLDPWGDHALSCTFGGGLITRHDALRDIVFSTCSQAHYHPKKEIKHLLKDSNKRPGDVFIPIWSRGRPAALDITVTSSMQPSTLLNASKKSGYVAERAENSKFSRIGNEANDHDLVFIPLAVESFGIWSELSLDTFQQIISRLKQFHSTKSYPHLYYFMQKLSICLQRHNANIMLEKYSSSNDSYDTPCLPNSSYFNSNW